MVSYGAALRILVATKCTQKVKEELWALEHCFEMEH